MATVTHLRNDDGTALCGRPNAGPPGLPVCKNCRRREGDAERWRMPERGFSVYALRSTIGGREIIKFGQSISPVNRLLTIRRDMPEPVDVIGVWPTCFGDAPIHMLLSDSDREVRELERLENGRPPGWCEWYYRDEEVDRVVEMLKAGHEPQWLIAQDVDS
jgi:hypothetical protein